MHTLLDNPSHPPCWTPVYQLFPDENQGLAANARGRITDRVPSAAVRARSHATIVPIEEIRRNTLFGSFREMLLEDED